MLHHTCVEYCKAFVLCRKLVLIIILGQFMILKTVLIEIHRQIETHGVAGIGPD